MIMWEYCELRWQVSSRYDMARPSVILYRDPGKAWSPPDAAPEQLALKLGLEGWELVAVQSYEGPGSANGPEVHWYFKRPIHGTGKAVGNGNGAKSLAAATH